MATTRLKHAATFLLCAASLPLAGCGVPGPGGDPGSFGLDLSVGPQAALSADGAKVTGAVVFLVDGLNARIFDEMLTAGDLPRIKEHFVDRGLHAPRAVGNLPSITLANLTSIATGCLPGHHGILGNNWFDREKYLWRNYETIDQKNALDGDYTAPTIFERLSDRFTSSIFFQPHRGAGKWFENALSAAPPYGFGWYELVDRISLYRFGELAGLARDKQQWPAVTICYLLAPDFRAYENGVGSEKYREAIRHTDRQIGRVLGDFQRAGLYDKLAFVLVSDHGLGHVTRHWSLEQSLEGLGLMVAGKELWEETSKLRRKDYYNKFDAVTYGSGDRYKAVCLRSREANGDLQPWPQRPIPVDLVGYPAMFPDTTVPRKVPLLRSLVSPEAVDTVAYASGANLVRIQTMASGAEFSQPRGRGGDITYRLVSGTDPFGWKGKVPDEMLAGKPASGRAWLEATVDTEFPDLPEPLLAYFRAKRRGDIVLFAAPGWDFGKVNKAGHGGLRPSDMHVPLLLAGPGIPHGKLTAARSVDIMPTILHLLGKPIPKDIDGRNLLK